MKKFILVSFISLLILSCKKENNSQSPKLSYFNQVVANLKDSLSVNDFSRISTEKAFMTKISSRTYLRMPFKGKDISKEFVLLQTDNSGKIVKGFIINLVRNTSADKEYKFNGFIIKSSLNRIFTSISNLTNGIITRAQSGSAASRDLNIPNISFPIPKDTVIIVTTGDVPPDDNGGITYSDWISISGIFGYYGSYSSYGTFGATGEFLYGGGGLYSMAGNTPDSRGTHTVWIAPEVDADDPQITNTDALLVDFESSEDLSPIDVTKFLKCFANIPDQGSSCSIEIFTDIPVDKNANKLFNWQTLSPGHTFLQIKKTNGNQSVIQNIGFYPIQGWKTLLTTAPVDAKFVDNSEHEYNASLKMNISPDKLNEALTEINYLSTVVKYDIDEFNCTDFALDVFNKARATDPVEIPKYDIPGGTAPNGSNTPQGLYNELKIMQQSGLESGNITMPAVKAFVADSNGPCN